MVPKIKSINITLLLLIYFCFTLQMFSGTSQILIVPETTTPPEIDGVIGKAEWRHAAAITGLVNYKTRELETFPLVVYITYDKKFFYMAFSMPFYPNGTAPKAPKKNRRDTSFFGEDLIELWIDPANGHYKNAQQKNFHFMGNSKNFIKRDSYSIPQIGLFDNTEWNGNWNFRNNVSNGKWNAELSIPLKDLEVDTIKDGDIWSIHISRFWACGIWSTISSKEKGRINDSAGALKLKLAKNPVYIQLTDLAPLAHGKVGYTLFINNSTKQTGKVTIESRIEDLNSNKKIFSCKEELKVKSNQRKKYSLLKTAALGKKNFFKLKVTDSQGNICLQDGFAFTGKPNYPPLVKEKVHLIKFNSRYLPSFNKIWIDAIDISNLADQNKNEKISCTLELTSSKGSIFSCPVILKDNVLYDKAIQLSKPLEAGNYSLTLKVFGNNRKFLGKEVFKFKHFKHPFTMKKLGMADIVLPPFTPLSMDGNILKVWGREYKFNSQGIFSQITAVQPEPTVDRKIAGLLSGDMYFQVKDSSGRVIPFTGDNFKIKERSGTKASFESELTAGNISLLLKGKAEYDGLIDFNLKIIPEKTTEISELALIVPLDRKLTLMHEVSDRVRRIYAGTIPAGNGVVWDSSKIKNSGSFCGNFKPMIWIGNEDRGLTWFSDTDKGWLLDDKKPSYEVIRNKNGNILLKILFVNNKYTLSKPTELSFGFMATPVKPLPEAWRSWVMSHREVIKDRKNLREIVGLGSHIPYPYRKGVFSEEPGDIEKVKEILSTPGRKYSMCYNIQNILCASDKVAELYNGEWAGPNTTIQYWGSDNDRKKHFYNTDNKKNYCCYRLRAFSSESYRDYRVWALNLFLSKLDEFTFYEDNAGVYMVADPAQNIGYRRKNGLWQPEFNILGQRKLYKRMATLYHQHGMENLIAVHKSTTMLPQAFSFVNMVIDGEQRFVTSQRDYFDLWPLEYVRAHVMGRQFGFVPINLGTLTKVDRKFKDPGYKVLRSAIGLFWLHDVKIWPTFTPKKDRKVLYELYALWDKFDVGDKRVRLYPYWADNEFKAAACENKCVKVDVWDKEKGDDAVCLIVNTGGDTVKAEVKFNKKILPSLTGVYNWETKKRIQVRNHTINVDIPSHDFVILWLRKKGLLRIEAQPTMMAKKQSDDNVKSITEPQTDLPIPFTNSDFEKEGKNNKPLHWHFISVLGSQANFTLDKDDKYKGQYSLKIDKLNSNGYSEARSSYRKNYRIHLQGGKKYLLSGYFKSNIRGIRVYTIIKFFTSKGQSIITMDHYASTKWKKFKFAFKTPAATKWAMVLIRTRTSSIVHVDDLSITRSVRKRR